MPKGPTRSTNERKNLPADIEHWLDRNQVSDLIGISVSTIQNLERRDKLHPLRVVRADSHGTERLMYVYDPREVMKIPRTDRALIVRTPGEVAARAFELMDHGKTMREIVIDLREDPDKVRELKERWLDMGGSERVIAPPAWHRLEELVGPFGSVTELVERIEAITNIQKAKTIAND